MGKDMRLFLRQLSDLMRDYSAQIDAESEDDVICISIGNTNNVKHEEVSIDCKRFHEVHIDTVLQRNRQ